MPVVSGVITNILTTRAHRQLKLGVHGGGGQAQSLGVSLPSSSVRFARPAVSAGNSGNAGATVVELASGERQESLTGNLERGIEGDTVGTFKQEGLA